MDQAYIQPHLTKTAMGADYIYPAPKAIVEPGNPIGGAFTLPQSFFSYSGTFSITPKTGWQGYTTITVSNYYAGPGHFKADNAHTGPTPSRIVFPTTMGNPIPNYRATGNPVTPTTTFDGLYDFNRAGSINVTPGPRRFGGTMRVFYRPTAYWYQYVSYFSPAIYKGYAGFSCINNGVICTPGNHVSNPGDITELYRLTRFLLNVKGSGTGDQRQSNTAKATTPITPYGQAPTPNGNASFITGVGQYVNTIHPWTTGFASVTKRDSFFVYTPQAQGYDTSLGGADITVTHHDWNSNWNKTLSTLTTTTATWKQYLYGVRRVVSMVRPRLIHSYSVPLDPVNDPIKNTWSAARLWRLKVFFVPEPAGMLMLGAGIAALLGLSRMRRR
jgi:hypothetical protein